MDVETHTFCLPDLGEGLTESEVIAWHVSEGDHVVADQPLLSIETEKAVVEVPAPCAGTVSRLCAAPGDVIKVGDPLVEFASAPADTGTVVGEIPEASPPAGSEQRSHEAAPGAKSTRVRAAPAVRKRARELGVDLEAIAGTGERGNITVADVERMARTAGDALSSQPAGWLPLRGIRRTMAKQMSRAGAQVVPATLTDEADIDSWPSQSAAEACDPMLRLVQAVAAACLAQPALNAWYDADTGMRLLHAELRLGLAVDTSDGLVVPVLTVEGDEGARTLRPRLTGLIDNTKKRLVAPAELSGATFTLSNFGTLGGRHAALVVMPPQVAILGAGRIKPSVVADSGVPAVHRTLPLSLTFDHRVVSGGEAALFMRAVIDALQSAEHVTTTREPTA